MFDESIKKLQEFKKDILWFELLFFCFFFTVIVLSVVFSEVKIWGDKADALFDIWFLQHTLSGMILSFLLLSYPLTRKYSLLVMIVIAYSWECIEFFLETDSYDAVMFWMAGLEHPLNRFVIDPLAAILGFLLINRFPRWIYFCLILNISFIVLHLWIGDSMAIQQFLY